MLGSSQAISAMGAGAQGARGSHHAGKSESSRNPTSTPQLHVKATDRCQQSDQGDIPRPLQSLPRSIGPKQCCAFQVTVVSLEAAASLSVLAHTSGSLRSCCPCPQATVSTKMLVGGT